MNYKKVIKKVGVRSTINVVTTCIYAVAPIELKPGVINGVVDFVYGGVKACNKKTCVDGVMTMAGAVSSIYSANKRKAA